MEPPRASLLMLFSACAISVVRLAELYLQDGASDPSWDSSSLSYWTVIELNVGIMCACLPTLRPIIKKFIPALLGSTDGPTKGRSSLKLSTLRTTKPKPDFEDGIYIHRDVEFHSTTELRSKLSKDALKDPFAEREPWADIEGAETNETYKGDTSCLHVPIDKD